MHLLAGLAVLLVGTHAADMQKQCLCSDFNPCYDSGADTVQKCADKCQKHLTDLGGDYAEASKCVKAHQKKIEEAAACTRKNLGELCAAEPGKEVPKRFHETLQIAAVKEITDMVKKSGLLGKTTELFEVAKKSAGCMLKCADSTSCAKKLKCGLALPGDNEVVATAKKCALEAGFTTPVAREICTCLSKAGVKKLDDICPSITIS